MDSLFGIISIFAMGEISDLIEECGDGSSPSEAHYGEWEGLWREWTGTDAGTDYIFIVKDHGN